MFSIFIERVSITTENSLLVGETEIHCEGNLRVGENKSVPDLRKNVMRETNTLTPTKNLVIEHALNNEGTQS